MHKDFSEWIPPILVLAKQASDAIMEIFLQKNYSIKNKGDKSPVTEADIRAHHIIEQGLQIIAPGVPILSEEGNIPPLEQRKDWKEFWLVDPLDGTKEFIKGSSDFTVNIALIRDHKPVLGVVVAPALKQYYWGSAQGAFFQQEEKPIESLHVHNTITSPLKVAVSRDHSDTKKEHWRKLMSPFERIEYVYRGSALKICLVAQGVVDFYPRLSPTGEWDTAAGQCILEAAGGKLVDLSGRAFQYNARETLENSGFLAIGCVDLLTYLVDKSV